MFRALLLLFAVLMTAPAYGSDDVALQFEGGLSLTLHNNNQGQPAVPD